MWRPGFRYQAAFQGTLTGAHRALCVTSFHHRGTRERPGLVLGLDEGGQCAGVVFQVAGEDWDEVLAYLREREQVTGVYIERTLPVRIVAPITLEDAGPAGNAQAAPGEPVDDVEALVYVVDRAHTQYARPQPIADMARIIEGARGVSGDNRDYVLNTVDHLDQMGLRDEALHTLAGLLRA